MLECVLDQRTERLSEPCPSIVVIRVTPMTFRVSPMTFRDVGLGPREPLFGGENEGDNAVVESETWRGRDGAAHVRLEGRQLFDWRKILGLFGPFLAPVLNVRSQSFSRLLRRPTDSYLRGFAGFPNACFSSAGLMCRRRRRRYLTVLKCSRSHGMPNANPMSWHPNGIGMPWQINSIQFNSRDFPG